MSIEAYEEYDGTSWTDPVKQVYYAEGNFSWEKANAEDLSDPERTAFDRLNLKVQVDSTVLSGNAADLNDTHVVVNLKAPDGFSFSADTMVPEAAVIFESVPGGGAARQNLVLYPAYSQYEAYADLVALMKAMLNYGGWSQVYFGSNTNDLANAGLDLALPELTADDVAAYAHGADGSEDGIRVASVSLLLESTTTIRFYFELDGTKSIDEYTFYVDGVKTTPVESDGQYYVDKVNVAAKDLDEMVTVTVGGLTAKYCGLSYVRQVAVQYPAYYSEALVNVTRALCAYNQAANAYFG